jgi:CRP/FNR family transcriptional regulator, cyclic AMP receptor protein
MDGGTAPVGSEGARFLPPDLVSQLLPRGRQVRVKRDQIIIAEGTLSTDVYLVISGAVQVSVLSLSGRETIFRTMGPNELVGELAAIDNGERSATVVALADSVLAHLSAEQFRRYLSEVPMAGFWMVQQLTHRVRDLSLRAVEMANLTVSGRLIAELLRLARSLDAGSNAAGVTIADLPTQAELAARIGASREKVNRELRSLAQQGLVDQSGRTLTLPSLSALQAALGRQQR